MALATLPAARWKGIPARGVTSREQVENRFGKGIQKHGGIVSYSIDRIPGDVTYGARGAVAERAVHRPLCHSNLSRQLLFVIVIIVMLPTVTAVVVLIAIIVVTIADIVI